MYRLVTVVKNDDPRTAKTVFVPDELAQMNKVIDINIEGDAGTWTVTQIADTTLRHPIAVPVNPAPEVKEAPAKKIKKVVTDKAAE